MQHVACCDVANLVGQGCGQDRKENLLPYGQRTVALLQGNHIGGLLGHVAKDAAVFGVSEGLGKTDGETFIALAQHGMAGSPFGGEEHRLGQVVDVANLEKALVSGLETKLRHTVELHLAHRSCHARGGIRDGAVAALDGRSSVKNHQLPRSQLPPKGAFVAIEKGADGSLLTKVLGASVGCLLSPFLQGIAQEHILRLVPTEQPLQFGNRQLVAVAAFLYNNGLAVGQQMTVGILIVNLEIAQ